MLTDEKLAPTKEPAKRPLYIPGVKLTKEDIKHLESEKMDAAMLAELKAFKGTVKEFIDHCISKDSAKEKQNKLAPIVIKNNIRSRSVNGYIREFEANEKFRQHTRRDSVLAFHTILSFSALDSKHLNEKVLKDIAQKYISLRAEQSLVVGGVHMDRQHTHIHLIQSGVQYCTGVSNRISRQQFKELTVAMQEYQKEKYPQLVNSTPEHGKSKNGITKESGPEKNIKTERLLDKDILLGLLETTYASSTSKEHFLAQLQEQGHVPYYRNGRLQGVKFEGERKFRINRLGYDEKKLQELDIRKEMQEKSLNESRQLRNGRTKTAEKTKSSEAAKSKSENELLYHGTAKGNYFDAFDLSRENRGIGSNAFHQGKNIYLTDREDAAAYFSKQATETYQLWKCIFDKTDPGNIKSETGEVYKVQLTKNINLKVLDHRPDKEEVEKLKAEGYDAVKFKDIAYEAIEGSKEVFDMLKKGVPNTIVVFDSEKIEILENNKPKDLIQEKPLLKQLPFEVAARANIGEKDRAALQEMVNRDKAFEAKNGITRESSPVNQEAAQLQELRNIRESRGKEMDRTDSFAQNGRDEDEGRDSDTDRNDTEDKSSEPEEDAEDEDSTSSNDDTQVE